MPYSLFDKNSMYNMQYKTTIKRVYLYFPTRTTKPYLRTSNPKQIRIPYRLGTGDISEENNFISLLLRAPLFIHWAHTAQHRREARLCKFPFLSPSLDLGDDKMCIPSRGSLEERKAFQRAFAFDFSSVYLGFEVTWLARKLLFGDL